MKNFILGLLLFIIALIMFVPLAIWGIIEVLIALFYKKRFWNGLRVFGEFILLLAVILDVAINVITKVPFNRLLIKKDGFKFGNRRDTISRVLGINERDNKLTKLGDTLCRFLNFIDKDHCKKSI